MIPYIDAQLSIWAKWATAQATRSVGYPSQCPMFRERIGDGDGYGSGVPVGVQIDDDQAIRDTDEAVRRLTQEQRRLVVEYYVIGGSSVAVASRVGIAKRTMFDRLHTLHQVVMGHLNDVAAGA